MPDWIELDHGGYSCDEHGILEQHADLLGGECGLGRCSDDGDWRKVRDEHREHVLQSERNGLSYRDPSVEPVNIVDAYRFERFILMSHSNPPSFLILYYNDTSKSIWTRARLESSPRNTHDTSLDTRSKTRT